jgi:glycosyltransferase involved in cell wall biosynthesis
MSQVVSDQLRSQVGTRPVYYSPHPIYDNYGPPVAPQEAKKELGLPEKEPLLLFFGFIRPYKGLDLLLEAVSDERFKDKKFKVVVAGEWYEDSRSYYEMIKKLNIGERLIMKDHFIPESQVATYFSAADVCVLPYRSATQSGITATALHFEVPLIVTNVGGLSEAVKGGELGYVVNEPDPIQLKVGIETYFENTNQNQYIDAIQREKKQNSWSNFAAQLMGFAQNICANTY